MQPCRAPAYSRRGVVVAEHPLAAAVGARVLEEGGNAADAAVAVSFTLAVVLPHLGGLGGDFFALTRSPDGRVAFFHGGGYSPQGLTLEALERRGYRGVPERGALSIVVPGLVDGLRVLWETMGSLEWRMLVEPAARIAEEGYGVTHSLARATAALCPTLLSRDPGSAKTYCRGGHASPGSWARFPGLAKALREIAADPRQFYEGRIAESIVEYVQSRGGLLSLEDMAEYRAHKGEPIKTSYRGATVYEMPPNTQGITTLHILRLLEEEEAPPNPFSTTRAKALLDAWIPAYKARDRYLGDPRYMEYSVEQLLSKEFIDKMREEAGDQSGQQPGGGGGDTTFYAVIDGEGAIVAGIQSLFHPFGSGVTEPVYQIPLNSRASGFTAKPGPNRIGPRKMPLHTLSAMIVEEGDKVYAIGLSGGHYRPQLHSLIATNILDYGMEPLEAIEAPRLVWPPGSNTLRAEQGFEPLLWGYSLERLAYPSRLGVAAIAVLRGDRVMEAYADPRGDGVAQGLPY